MKRRLPALLLTLAFASSLFPAALGAEVTTFVDINPGDWFAPYVEVCVEKGLMKGVGNLIDREGNTLLDWGKYSGFSHPYDDPEYAGPTRYKFYDQLHLHSRSGWVDPETGEEFFFPAGQEPVTSNDHFKNGYLNGYDRYYGLDLKPVTQKFEFTWDVDPEGGGYVRWGEKIWRIQFEP